MCRSAFIADLAEFAQPCLQLQCESQKKPMRVAKPTIRPGHMQLLLDGFVGCELSWVAYFRQILIFQYLIC